jgi:CheY-like chemotaxis protein/HPt (histidine-containing phosphotransfer) domain-containing protein
MTKPVKQSALLQCIQEVVGTARAVTAPAHAVNGDTLRNMQVLLAEDNIVNQKLACRILEKLGATVTIADNGEAAIAALAAATFDVILMDCQMPVLDGYETTRRIRMGAAGVDASKLPIIALTAHALGGDRDRCLAAGMNDYLTKPIDPAALRSRLEELLGTDSPRVQATRENPDAQIPSAVLDEAVLRGHIGDDSRFLEELLGVLVVTIDEQVVALLGASTRGQIPAMATHAHSIKGAAANVGASALMRAAAALESAALEGAVEAHEIESVHTAWRDLQRHPKVEPFVKKSSRVA